MTTINHDQLGEEYEKQTVARLTLALDKTTEEIARAYISNYLENVRPIKGELPTGATIVRGTGHWYPEEDDLESEIEDNLIIELWIDTEEELKGVEAFKDDLETRFNQHCVCLSLETKTFKH